MKSYATIKTSHSFKDMARLDIKDLLLAPKLESGQVTSLLSPYGFKDIEKADANLQEMADDPRARQLLTEILEELLSCLSQSADPDRALNYLERFTKAALNRINLYSYLKGSPHTLELLAKTFAASPFMAEILIRDPEYLYWVSDSRTLHQERKRREIERDISGALKNIRTYEKKLDILRILKRKEILRIGVRDLLKLSTVEETVASLSILAEALIQKAYQICEASIRKKCGIPFHKGTSGERVRTGFTVLGMGKLGGGELNFSSDVDLIYLYASDQGGVSQGRARAPSVSTAKANYFRELAQMLTAALNEITNEGYVYRVDLRLRPEGRAGSIAYSLNGFKRYYAARGETWERMALIKARPVAGDRALGVKFIAAVIPFIYGRPFDLKALEEIKRIKVRIDQKISRREQTHRNVKLGFGGIREIEFIVQSLQLCYGRKFPKIRERTTMKALRSLLACRLLSEEEFRCLSEAYPFLRDVENKLQMVYDFQTHALPSEEKELRECALRLGYQDTDRCTATEEFLKDYHFHTGRVNGVFQSVFYSSAPSRFIRRD
jgi:[glutamine synthetase] adenylyltransferase / [glutamine synthetase]-adenylyl-L-tyrosine phosphorylase